MSGELSKTWRLLKPHVRPQAGRLVMVLALGALLAAVQAAPLLLLQPLWNQVLFPGLAEGRAPEERSYLEVMCLRFAGIDPQTPSQDLGPEERLAALVTVAVVAFLLALVAATAQFFYARMGGLIAYSMIVDLRMRIARHLMNLSLRYHNQRLLGDLLSRISADVSLTLTAVKVSLRRLIQAPFLIIGLLAVAFYSAPWPTVGIILVLPLLVFPVAKLARKVRRGSTKSLTRLGASIQTLSQMFLGVRTVKAFRAEERELERFHKNNQEYLDTSMKMVHNVALTHSWATFFSTAGMALLTLVLGLLTIRFGFFDDGARMMAFLGAIMLASNHVKAFTRSFTHVQESVGASERLQEILDNSADVVESPDARPISAIRDGVRFENVSFSYPEGEMAALAEIDLELRPGETLALVGPSGAGKSTLVDLIARFHDVSEGRITVDGVDLRDLRLGEWTGLYALVSQVPFLFHTTVAENIRYGDPSASQDQIEEAARAAHIHDFIAGLADGYETNVADMGARLSGGQRQRITIARALLKRAPLLLLDEATSSLDSESEAEVQQALDQLMVGRTVVVVAHRLSTIQSADRIAVLEGGRLVELGSHDEILGKGGVYSRLWDLQKLGTVGVQ